MLHFQGRPRNTMKLALGGKFIGLDPQLQIKCLEQLVIGNAFEIMQAQVYQTYDYSSPVLTLSHRLNRLHPGGKPLRCARSGSCSKLWIKVVTEL